MGRRQWLAELPPGPSAAPSEPASETPAIPAGSLRARALDAVTRIAEKLDLVVTPVHRDPSQLSMLVSDGHGRALSVFAERARENANYYQRVGRLGLWYGGDAESSNPPWTRALLEAAARELLAPPLDALADELPARVALSTSAQPLDAPSPPDPANPYARRRIFGADDVERFFHVDYQYEPGTEVIQPPTTRIGIIYQCNQPCTFCQLAEMNTHIPPARVYAALDASHARGARRVILTGGEPTMCRHLIEYVRYARERGYTTIELQTNATLLDDAARAVALRQAGLTDAQVSLHGPDGEISDRLTGAPGTHRRTLDGIGNLLDAGARVLLNHLVFRDNCHLLLDFVDMVEERWGRHRERIIIQFHSPLNEFERPELARQHIARYTEYAPLLRRAIDHGRALGYWVRDMQDPTGIPALCVLGADSSYVGPILPQRHRPRFHRWESSWSTRVAACEQCEIAHACMGIPRRYLELYGDEEFRPVRLRDLSA